LLIFPKEDFRCDMVGDHNWIWVWKDAKPARPLGWLIYIYRIGAAAGIGSACGLGASPTPVLRESARAVPRTRKWPTLFLNST
jgi:hypothetical protein